MPAEFDGLIHTCTSNNMKNHILSVDSSLIWWWEISLSNGERSAYEHMFEMVLIFACPQILNSSHIYDPLKYARLKLTPNKVSVYQSLEIQRKGRKVNFFWNLIQDLLHMEWYFESDVKKIFQSELAIHVTFKKMFLYSMILASSFLFVFFNKFIPHHSGGFYAPTQKAYNDLNTDSIKQLFNKLKTRNSTK